MQREAVVLVEDSLRDFVKKVTLGREIDLPLEVSKDKIEVKRKDIAMKVVGTYSNFELKEGEPKEGQESILFGFPNAKTLINYLTVVGKAVLVKEVGDIEIVHILPADEKKSVSFSAVLSIFSQPDVKPPKLEGFIFDFEIRDKVKEIFEVVKIVKSDVCGIFIDENNEVYFRVGGETEDRGSVFLGEVDTLPQGKFVKDVEGGKLITFRQIDMADTLSVVDKSGKSGSIKIRMKGNGGLFITEEGDGFTVNYGFVPYV